MFTETLKDLVAGKQLSEQEAAEMMDEIMEGKASSCQIAAYLSLLSMRGETVDELAGSVRSMRAHAKPLHYKHPLIDIVGTGGDGTATFNISTAAALVLSSLGICVAKHGNRSVSSTSGAADALEALGIDIRSTPEYASELLDQTHMCFLFAPLYHASMKYAIEPRKALGFRTIFNQLGPLTNPAGAERQLLGVYSVALAERYAQAIVKLGTEKTLVVTGEDGMDELTIAGRTDAFLIENGAIQTFSLTPEDVGLSVGNAADIQVKNPKESAELIETIFAGSRQNKTAADAVLLNAGAGLYVSGKTHSIAEGVHEAREAINSGAALNQLNLMRRQTVETAHV
ncbi:anthranilate phosphoribosyltransferase [Sporolactobacillus shoreicorticis]|uniref:Anthranilate phosphoribosyltransferase n=1 Tax=Sporolactobacillus shoreicorticis TaxID=1923877 RepID=A0ABW5RZW5_9BACL|nr:anthranilate phosphoribosyltransferase [Sporolactobacillus shoreicorticis]MCO7127031.1 anthranilate phosphoribosyltransferase [Sporolactobacillus shoreicorticis]